MVCGWASTILSPNKKGFFILDPHLLNLHPMGGEMAKIVLLQYINQSYFSFLSHLSSSSTRASSHFMCIVGVCVWEVQLEHHYPLNNYSWLCCIVFLGNKVCLFVFFFLYFASSLLLLFYFEIVDLRHF